MKNYLTVGDLIRELEKENKDAEIEVQFTAYHYEGGKAGSAEFTPRVYKTNGISKMMVTQTQFAPMLTITKNSYALPEGKTGVPYKVLLRFPEAAEPCFTDRIIETKAKEPAIRWFPCETVNDAYIRNGGQLHHGRTTLLITYRATNGRKYVTLANVDNGRIQKTIHGEVIAWAYLPEPYEAEQETEGKQ